jgi:hypothetical protein
VNKFDVIGDWPESIERLQVKQTDSVEIFFDFGYALSYSI